MVLSLVLGAAAVAAGPALSVRSTQTHSRLAVAASAFLPLVAAVLFYSLALHMYGRLGAWPEQIGSQGFPDGLLLHAEVAQVAFGALILGGMFFLPLSMLFCLCVPRLRSSLWCLGIYGCGSVAAFVLMQLAPAPFLDWWWD